MDYRHQVALAESPWRANPQGSHTSPVTVVRNAQEFPKAETILEWPKLSCKLSISTWMDCVCVLIIHDGSFAKQRIQGEPWYGSLVSALLSEKPIEWINSEELKAAKRDRDGLCFWSDYSVRAYFDAEAWTNVNMQTDRADVCALSALLRILQRQYCEAVESTNDFTKWLIVVDARWVCGSADMREIMHVIGCLQAAGAEQYNEFILSLCAGDLLTSNFETGLLGDRSKTFKKIAEFGHESNPSRRSCLYTTRRPRPVIDVVMQGGQYSFGAFVLSPQVVLTLCQPNFRFYSTNWQNAWMLFAGHEVVGVNMDHRNSSRTGALLLLRPTLFQDRRMETMLSDRDIALSRNPKTACDMSPLIVWNRNGHGWANCINTITSVLWIAHHTQLPVCIVDTISNHRPQLLSDFWEEKLFEHLPEWCAIPWVKVLVGKNQHLVQKTLNDQVGRNWNDADPRCIDWFSMAKCIVPNAAFKIQSYLETLGLRMKMRPLSDFMKLTHQMRSDIVAEMKMYVGQFKQSGSPEKDTHGFHIRKSDQQDMHKRWENNHHVRYDFQKAFNEITKSIVILTKQAHHCFVSTCDRSVYEDLQRSDAVKRYLHFGPMHFRGWNSHPNGSVETRPAAASAGLHVAGIRQTMPMDFLRDMCMVAATDHLHYSNESTMKYSFESIKGECFYTRTANSTYEPESLSHITSDAAAGLKKLIASVAPCAANADHRHVSTWIDWIGFESLKDIVEQLDDSFMDSLHRCLFGKFKLSGAQQLNLPACINDWKGSRRLVLDVEAQYVHARSNLPGSTRDWSPTFLQALFWHSLALHAMTKGKPFFMQIGSTVVAVDLCKLPVTYTRPQCAHGTEQYREAIAEALKYACSFDGENDYKKWLKQYNFFSYSQRTSIYEAYQSEEPLPVVFPEENDFVETIENWPKESRRSDSRVPPWRCQDSFDSS